MSRLVLPFLGQRVYLHGTTVLPALLAAAQFSHGLSENMPFSFKVAQPLFTNHVELFVPCAEETCEPNAVLQYAGQTVAVRELPPVLPAFHEEFDEKALSARADFDLVGEGRAYAEFTPDAAFARSAVLLFKALLLQKQSMPPTGQWLFIRMDGIFPLPACGALLLIPLPSKVRTIKMAHVLFKGSRIATLYFAYRTLTGEK